MSDYKEAMEVAEEFFSHGNSPDDPVEALVISEQFIVLHALKDLHAENEKLLEELEKAKKVVKIESDTGVIRLCDETEALKTAWNELDEARKVIEWVGQHSMGLPLSAHEAVTRAREFLSKHPKHGEEPSRRKSDIRNDDIDDILNKIEGKAMDWLCNKPKHGEGE